MIIINLIVFEKKLYFLTLVYFNLLNIIGNFIFLVIEIDQIIQEFIIDYQFIKL